MRNSTKTGRSNSESPIKIIGIVSTADLQRAVLIGSVLWLENHPKEWWAGDGGLATCPSKLEEGEWMRNPPLL